MKKALALILVLAMCLGLVACSSSADTTDTTDTTSDAATATADNASSSETQKTEADAPKEIVTLSWYFMGDDTEANDDVYDAANELLERDLGIHVEFHPIAPGDYEQQIKLVINSGEDYDICWASNWRNNYMQNVNDEAFLALDEYLEDCPDLVAAIPESLWECSKVNGTIYGVTCQQIVARSTSVAVPVDYVELFDGTVDVDNVTSYADLTDYIAAIGAEHPAEVICELDWQDFVYVYGIEAILGTKIPGAVSLVDDKITVFNQFDTDAWREVVRTRREWTEAGYTMPGKAEVGTTTDKQYERPLEISTYIPGYENDTMQGTNNFMVTQRQISDAYVTTGGVTATMMCVNVNSTHPAEAVKFLEYLNTSSELMNLLTFGIEGRDYERTADGKVQRLEDRQYNQFGWRLGNTFVLDLEATQSDEGITAVAALNASAKASKIAGFTPDTTNIQLEMTNCQSVVEEYYDLLNEGLTADTDKVVDEMNAKLETAGVKTIIDELQSQINAWLAEK